MWTLAWADCPQMDAALGAIESALLEARVDDADAALVSAEAALRCSEPVSRAALSRYFLLFGAVHHFAERPQRAAEAFVAAFRSDPKVHIRDFGPVFDAAVEEAVLEAPQTFSRVRTVPPEPDAVALFNGREQPLPAELDVGLWVVQFVRDEKVVFADTVRTLPGEEVILETGLTAPTLPEPVAPIHDTASRRPPWLLATGAVTGVLAVGCGALWARENQTLRRAGDLKSLHAGRDRQIGFSTAGIGLAVASAGMVGLHFAVTLPHKTRPTIR